jgi:TolB-like protein
MTRPAPFAAIAAALLGLAAPAARLHAQADTRPTVAIMFFNNNVFTKDARDYDGLTKGIADFLITEMAANPSIRLIERDQVQKLVDEQKLVTGGQVDRETAVRLGKLLGAQHMIFGGFMADPRGNFRIDARAVSVEQGVIEYSERVQDKSDNVMELIGTLAARMNAGMHLPGIARRTGEASAPVPATGAAVQAGAPTPAAKLPMKYAVMYGKALDLTDRGDRTRAVELFGAVLKDFPDFEPAKKARARLTTGG